MLWKHASTKQRKRQCQRDDPLLRTAGVRRKWTVSRRLTIWRTRGARRRSPAPSEPDRRRWRRPRRTADAREDVLTAGHHRWPSQGRWSEPCGQLSEPEARFTQRKVRRKTPPRDAGRRGGPGRPSRVLGAPMTLGTEKTAASSPSAQTGEICATRAGDGRKSRGWRVPRPTKCVEAGQAVSHGTRNQGGVVSRCEVGRITADVGRRGDDPMLEADEAA